MKFNKNIMALSSLLLVTLVAHIMLQLVYALMAQQYNTQPGWSSQLGLFALDRLLYLLVFAGGAIFIFYHLLARQLGQRGVADIGSFFQPVTALSVGFGIKVLAGVVGGVVLYGLLALYGPDDNLSQDLTQSGRIQNEIILNRPPFLLILFFTGILTPIIEEFYYRGILYSFIQLWGGRVAALAITTLIFALAHGAEVRLFLGGVALILGILCWRFGLLSSSLAHIIYNSLILADYYHTDI